MPIRPILPALPVLLLAGACSAPAANYPSLLPRAVEGRSDAERASPTPVAAPDPALDGAVAAARATLAEVTRDADALLGGAVPREAPAAGSEAWIAAQVMLARLDEVRARASDVATDLAQRAIARAADGQPPSPALDDAAAEAQALLDRIDRSTVARQAALPPA